MRNFLLFLCMFFWAAPVSFSQTTGDLDYLERNGVSEKLLKDPPLSIDLPLLVSGCGSGRFPKDLLPRMVPEKDLSVWSIKIAEKDPDFERGKKWVKEYLKRSLRTRKHVYRSGTDYREDIETIDRVENIHMLYLLKSYVDLFDKTDVQKSLSGLFPKPESDEAGGLILIDQNGLSLLSIRPFDDEKERESLDIDARNYYRIPRIVYYVPNAGTFHTHPLEIGKSPSLWSGPSCSCFRGRTIRPTVRDVDTTVAKNLARSNPYFMHIVISEIEKGRYNIDAFFYDVIVGKNGKTETANKITVIDLGMFGD